MIRFKELTVKQQAALWACLCGGRKWDVKPDTTRFPEVWATLEKVRRLYQPSEVDFTDEELKQFAAAAKDFCPISQKKAVYLQGMFGYDFLGVDV